ncbi:hypothetical protein [Nocardioides sp. YIM 152588]|uniref:hypothetical protein n=1 Tax=Nocardioides sp. YIM 152588 TaxID=3158259 RepID=UPI0032E45B04
MRRGRIGGEQPDRGAVLIIALIVVTVVAVVTAAVLSHGTTNLSATVALGRVADRAGAADAAAKIAINDLRLGGKAPGITAPDPDGDGSPSAADWVYTDAGDGAGCFGLSGGSARDALVLNGLLPAADASAAPTSARVECTKVAGTGLYGGGGGVVQTAQNTFPRALTAFGGDITYDGGGLLEVRGGVAASGDVRLTKYYHTLFYRAYNNPALTISGQGQAPYRCNGPSGYTGVKLCTDVPSSGSLTSPTVADALTALTALTDATPRDPSAVANVSGTCTFDPGYYDNATTLSDRVNSCSVSVFRPGLYYFDFQNELSAGLGNGLMSGDNVWRVTGSRTIIGGTRSPGNPTLIPGACVSPLSDPTADGVRFVFGGNSRMESIVPVTALDISRYNQTPKIELCGTYSATEPPVVIQQQAAGAAPVDGSSTPSATTATATTVATTGSTPGFAGATASALAAADESPTRLAATWTGAAATGQKAALSLGGLAPDTAPPPGSVLKGASIVVSQAVSGGLDRVKVKVTGMSGTVDLPLRTTLPAADTVTVPGASLGALASWVHAGAPAAGAPTIDLTYTPTIGTARTLTVDAASLRLEYYPPAVHAGSTPSADPFLEIFYPWQSGYPNNWPRFVVNGAVYARNGDVSLEYGLTLTNPTFGPMVSVRGGIAARSIDMIGGQWGRYGYPLAGIPDLGAGIGAFTTVVDLEVYVCPDAATCSSGGSRALTARVKITDPPYGDEGLPTAGNRRIEVLSWAEQR